MQTVYINLATKNLNNARMFYESIGWQVNPDFTDDTAACLVINDALCLMVLTEQKMQEFTSKKLADPKNSTEAINAIALSTKAAVDALIEKVITAGGKETRKAEDYGFMYQRSFEDIDGHLWEALWLNPDA